MCIDIDGHHFDGSSFVYVMIFVIKEIVCIPTGTSSALKKKRKKSKESQYMVSHPKTGTDPPIGSVRESGRDKAGIKTVL